MPASGSPPRTRAQTPQVAHTKHSFCALLLCKYSNAFIHYHCYYPDSRHCGLNTEKDSPFCMCSIGRIGTRVGAECFSIKSSFFFLSLLPKCQVLHRHRVCLFQEKWERGKERREKNKRKGNFLPFGFFFMLIPFCYQRIREEKGNKCVIQYFFFSLLQ